jgi:hypothetical protein
MKLPSGGDPQLVCRGQAHVPENGHPQPSWELLPPEETRVAHSVLVHPEAKQILTAFIQGASKPEIARVFGVKEKLVRSVVAAAQQQIRN